MLSRILDRQRSLQSDTPTMTRFAVLDVIDSIVFRAGTLFHSR